MVWEKLSQLSDDDRDDYLDKVKSNGGPYRESMATVARFAVHPYGTVKPESSIYKLTHDADKQRFEAFQRWTSARGFDSYPRLFGKVLHHLRTSNDGMTWEKLLILKAQNPAQLDEYLRSVGERFGPPTQTAARRALEVLGGQPLQADA